MPVLSSSFDYNPQSNLTRALENHINNLMKSKRPKMNMNVASSENVLGIKKYSTPVRERKSLNLDSN